MLAGRPALRVALAVIALLIGGCSHRGGKQSAPTTTTSATSATAARKPPRASNYYPSFRDPKCPAKLPNKSVAAQNAGVQGLGKKLVPVEAVTVLVCRYLIADVAASSPLVLAGQGFITGASLVARLEAATNGLARVPSTPQKETCQRQEPTFLVSFADFSRRTASVEDTLECGWVTNGVFTAQGTRAWRDALSTYSPTTHY
jgi:hypothetical protein